MFEQYISNPLQLEYPKTIHYLLSFKTNNIDEVLVALSSHKKLALFGAGLVGLEVLKLLQNAGKKVDFFIDNNPNKVGQVINGIPVISVDNLAIISEQTDLVISTVYDSEVLTQLQSRDLSGIIKKIFLPDIPYITKIGLSLLSDIAQVIEKNLYKIETLFSLLEDEKSRNVLYGILNYHLTQSDMYIYLHSQDRDYPQYFDAEFISFSESECFVDAGVYDGLSSKEFITQVKNKFRKILLFEPNKDLTSTIENYLPLKSDSRIQLENYGLYDSEQIFKFDPNGASGKICESGQVTIETKLLDQYIDSEITFIKMDIEGAELNALHGAKQIIENYKPKLAISVYHKPFDLWEIPFYIKELVPDYKIYLRHYSYMANETVCYAVV
jgi:FkbM family methyltransferase